MKPFGIAHKWYLAGVQKRFCIYTSLNEKKQQKQHTYTHTFTIHIIILYIRICSRSESTTLSTAIPKDDTKSTLAQDDENNSDQCNKVKCTPKSSPESLSSPSDIAITPTNAKMYRCRFKAKSDHAKYENEMLFYFICL